MILLETAEALSNNTFITAAIALILIAFPTLWKHPAHSVGKLYRIKYAQMPSCSRYMA